MTTNPDISVVVPLFNEEENVVPLVRAVRDALQGADSWELVLVDDGSADGTATLGEEQAARDPQIRLVRLSRNFGQTPAMQAGFDHSRGSTVVSMDGDLQNDPADIPTMVAKLGEGYDLVVGYRLSRQDRIPRKIVSWIANRIINWLTGVAITDTGCSLKAYRRELLERMHLYSDMHRFIPAVAASVAGARITEIPVRHHPRRFGESKYGFSRIAKVMADLVTIKMIRSFRDRPLLMFGIGAVLFACLSTAFAVAAFWAIVEFGHENARAFVLPGAAMLLLALSLYLAMLGVVCEVALAENRRSERELPLLGH